MSGKLTWHKNVLRARKDIHVEKILCRSPDVNSPSQYLHVLFDPFLFEALCQDHKPTLQQVAKGNQGWGLLVFFCHGTKNWVIQENWGALVHPGMKKGNPHSLRLYFDFQQTSKTDAVSI
jgi:hypothetical protein